MIVWLFAAVAAGPPVCSARSVMSTSNVGALPENLQPSTGFTVAPVIVTVASGVVNVHVYVYGPCPPLGRASKLQETGSVRVARHSPPVAAI